MPGTGLITLQPGERIRDVFVVEQKLGQGGFGAVYRVLDQRDHQHYAMKTENRSNRQQILQMELYVLDLLKNKANFCAVRDRGRYTAYNYVVMTLVGDSLQAARKSRLHQRFKPATSLRIGMQTLAAIGQLHAIGFLHRDIKPANFAIGRAENHEQQCIYLLDFGMCRKYIDDKTGGVRSPRCSVPFKGTVRYASLNCHLNREQSRRDDLEAWWYMQMEMTNGRLPWRMEKDRDKVLGYKKAVTMDESAGGSALMRAQTMGIADPCYDGILKHIAKLQYDSAPDYNSIRAELQRAFNSLPRSPLMDSPFDWEKDSKEAQTTVAATAPLADRQPQGPVAVAPAQQQPPTGSRDAPGAGEHKRPGSAKSTSLRKMPFLPRPGMPLGAQLSVRTKRAAGTAGTSAAAHGTQAGGSKQPVPHAQRDVAGASGVKMQQQAKAATAGTSSVKPQQAKAAVGGRSPKAKAAGKTKAKPSGGPKRKGK